MQWGRFRTWSAAALARRSLLAERKRAWGYYQRVAPKLDVSWGSKKPTDTVARFSKHILASKNGGARLKYLEIGAFEGRSAAFVHSLLDGNVDITVIDDFDLNPEIADSLMRSAFSKFKANMAAIGAGSSVEVIKGQSAQHLPRLLADKRYFDIIFIDGSHATLDVIVDAAMSFKLLVAGGLMIFDDYWYRRLDIGRGYRPKLAIDGFVGAMCHEIDVLDVAAQVFIRKRRTERRW